MSWPNCSRARRPSKRCSLRQRARALTAEVGSTLVCPKALGVVGTAARCLVRLPRRSRPCAASGWTRTRADRSPRRTCFVEAAQALGDRGRVVRVVLRSARHHRTRRARRTFADSTGHTTQDCAHAIRGARSCRRTAHGRRIGRRDGCVCGTFRATRLARQGQHPTCHCSSARARHRLCMVALPACLIAAIVSDGVFGHISPRARTSASAHARIHAV